MLEQGIKALSNAVSDEAAEPVPTPSVAAIYRDILPNALVAGGSPKSLCEEWLDEEMYFFEAMRTMGSAAAYGSLEEERNLLEEERLALEGEAARLAEAMIKMEEDEQRLALLLNQHSQGGAGCESREEKSLTSSICVSYLRTRSSPPPPHPNTQPRQWHCHHESPWTSLVHALHHLRRPPRPPLQPRRTRQTSRRARREVATFPLPVLKVDHSLPRQSRPRSKTF